MDRMKWFEEARFGMFIHWGVYAEAGRGEWVRNIERISNEDYQQYVDAFHPEHFDPVYWAKLAKEAGMKYAVFTAKHHDGFCMFDSALTEYTSMHTNGRDYVREYIEAFRDAGLKIGLYYSLIDWHHPDYPHYGDRIHPERDNPLFKDYEYDFDRYLTYMHGQIRELCSNYGKIDILWTDYSYDDMTAEKWKGSELVDMIRSLQPDIILNNRLEASGEGFGSLISDHPSVTSGDFVSPEQIIPPNGIRRKDGSHVPWEACITMNNHWGYCRDDHYFKPAVMIVRKLTEVVSKGGNMLLNVGPDEEGRISEESVRVLKDIAGWMKKNHVSVHGCGYSGLEKPEYGRITKNGNKLYYHVMEPMIGGIPLTGIKRSQIEEIRLLNTDEILEISDTWITGNYPDTVFVDLGPEPILPDPIDTVIEVTLDANTNIKM